MSNDERTSAVKLFELRAPDFDLAKTLNSGQVFHWEKIDNGAGGSRARWTGKSGRVDESGDESINRFFGAIGDVAARVEQRGDKLFANVGADLLRDYFALDHPLGKIWAALPNDDAMKAAKNFCRGLRIIRQPKWECLATFICSSMKQVAHIRQISLKLRERFGDARKIDKYTVHTFPPAERLARCSEKELRECALGYRAKNLLATARLIASGDIDLERMSILPDVDLREGLCALPGVGAKVANCVMLFAYERLGAFPIDVWIERTLREKYFARKGKVTSKRLREFAASYFGEHGGYAQQYLFHHARMNDKRRRMTKLSPR